MILLFSPVVGEDRPATSFTQLMGHMDVVSIILDYFYNLYILILLFSHVLGEDRPETSYTQMMGLAMSNQRSFKIESFRFPAFVPKKIEYIRF